MKNIFKKLTRVIISLVLILSVLLPLRIMANGQNLTVGFGNGTVMNHSVTYNVDNTIVTVTIDSSYVLNNNKLTIDSDEFLSALTVSGFDCLTMDIRVYSDNQFNTYLTVDNAGKVVRESEGGYSDNINLVIEKKEEPLGDDRFSGTVYFV